MKRREHNLLINQIDHINFIGSVCKEESFKLLIMELLVQKFLNYYQEADFLYNNGIWQINMNLGKKRIGSYFD